ncbi:pyridoxamine 5'-phosphate oxidase family protein [Pseudobacillus wudalianchiensis]|uniref:General stress protein n=1 Tax=Pseudobacillus wudalianchiensis TaxID=1743143 RepID=A0A1B9ADY7_9BACI|nr:pyridoxamine 5'-phosphate oxidase family protein [Bacillus wudalianchiensis]OCA82021.1 general stress protein [Bacillus wudalianchiensis]
MEQLKTEILNILKENKVGTLATVKNNKPHTRYMTFYNEELTLYTPTGKDTYKVEEIDQNPHVHILIGYTGEGIGDTFLEIEGTAKIDDSQQTKERLWNEEIAKWFDGPNDPNYIVLTITPNTIRYMNKGEDTPQVLEL